jgi:Cysteine-rich CPCC
MKARHSFGRRTGTVVSFSIAEGAGQVGDASNDLSAQPPQTWPFHCTQLDSGARSIPLGTAVSFDVVAGLPGRWDAVSLTARSGAFLCPVCGASVVGDQGAYDICGDCDWEDDPVQRDDADALGANQLSLAAARSALTQRLLAAESFE